MAKSIFRNRIAAIGGHRISRNANTLTIGQSRTEEEVGTIEDGARKYELGAWEGEFSISGYTDEEVESRWLAELAKTAAPSNPLTLVLAAGNGTPGDDVAQIDGFTSNFNPGGEHGRVQTFEMSGRAHDRLMIGDLLESSVGTSGITAGQNGTAVQIGAIGATQKMVVVHHLLNFPAASGTSPTLDAKIESATDEAFTTPVDRFTLTQLTDTPVGHVEEIAGPVTDTWWRYVVTAVGGTGSPTLYVLVSAAIIAA